MSNHPLEIFPDLRKVAHDLRKKLESKDYIFFFAHNNAGKTRLSMEFKSIGEQKSSQDTLYFNAFTEDLFRWINDDANSNYLQNIFSVSNKSYFFNNLNELLPLESHVRQLIARHVDFDFEALHYF